MSNIKLLKLIPYKITTEKQHENQNDNSTDNKNMPEKNISKRQKKLQGTISKRAKQQQDNNAKYGEKM